MPPAFACRHGSLTAICLRLREPRARWEVIGGVHLAPLTQSLGAVGRLSMQTTAVHMSKTTSGMETKWSTQQGGKHMTPQELQDVKGVVMLVDNSNTWITGKKVAAVQQKLNISEDPRWRLNVGNLYDVVMEGSGGIRENGHALVRIFGSTPPPADGVWTRFVGSGQRFEVDLTKRSKCTGGGTKEKLVDHKFVNLMAADCNRINALVAVMPPLSGIMEVFKSRKYILCSGDRDYFDVVKTALDFKFPVSLWSFNRSLAQEYRVLETDYKHLFKIHLLDQYWDKIGFVEDSWGLKDEVIPASRTLVFCGPGLSNPDMVKKVEAFRDEIEVPVYTYECDDAIFLICHYELDHDLEEDLFRHARDAVGCTCNAGATGAEGGPCVLCVAGTVEVLGYPVFKQRRCKPGVHQFKDLEPMLPTQAKVFEAAGAEGALAAAVTVDKCSSTDEQTGNAWTAPCLKKQNASIANASKKKQQQNCKTRCKWREFCKKGSACAWYHPPAEEEFFKKRVNGKGIPLYKIVECDIHHDPSMLNAKVVCTFQHAWEPSLCIDCLGFKTTSRILEAKKVNLHNPVKSPPCKCSRGMGEERPLISGEVWENLGNLGYLQKPYRLKQPCETGMCTYSRAPARCARSLSLSHAHAHMRARTHTHTHTTRAHTGTCRGQGLRAAGQGPTLKRIRCTAGLEGR
jgi:hypothetical protein